MERSYKTVDKTSWGPGPWQEECDKVQWTDETTGMPCLAVRNHLGAWCGYVGVDVSHPLYEKDYNVPNVDVHGSLTYSGHCLEGPEEESICHVPEPGQPDDVWWFGFDCAHGFDLVPEMEARFREFHLETAFRDTTYKTLDYVRAETTSLAAQLKEIDGAKTDVQTTSSDASPSKRKRSKTNRGSR